MPIIFRPTNVQNGSRTPFAIPRGTVHVLHALKTAILVWIHVEYVSLQEFQGALTHWAWPVGVT
jgi:hypothetical protein